MSKKEKGTVVTQESISAEDLKLYFDYLISGNVSNQEEADRIAKMLKRVVTLSDVTVLYRTLNFEMNRNVTRLMEAFQIQQSVLDKLGATKEMYKEAQEEYDKMVAELQKELEGQMEGKEPDGEV